MMKRIPLNRVSQTLIPVSLVFTALLHPNQAIAQSNLGNTGGDLAPRNSQQFFERGQDRFEREIYLLRTDKLAGTADVLMVDDATEAETWAPQLETSPELPESQQN